MLIEDIKPGSLVKLPPCVISTNKLKIGETGVLAGVEQGFGGIFIPTLLGPKEQTILSSDPTTISKN